MRDCEVNTQCTTYINTDTLIQIFIVSSAEVTRLPDTGISDDTEQSHEFLRTPISSKVS